LPFTSSLAAPLVAASANSMLPGWPDPSLQGRPKAHFLELPRFCAVARAWRNKVMAIRLRFGSFLLRSMKISPRRGSTARTSQPSQKHGADHEGRHQGQQRAWSKDRKAALGAQSVGGIITHPRAA
jgi:hypothetical protein